MIVVLDGFYQKTNTVNQKYKYCHN